jgi:hypothetical protein
LTGSLRTSTHGRKRHNYATPDEVFDALLDKAANAEHAGNGSGVSFGT